MAIVGCKGPTRNGVFDILRAEAGLKQHCNTNGDSSWAHLRASAWTLLSLTCAGCSVEVTPSDTRAVGSEQTSVGGDVEIFSWWTSGGEQDALDALAAVHRERVPSADVQNRAVEFATKAREQLLVRFAEGLPPDIFQTNAGQDLFSWVITNGDTTKDSLVEDLSDLYEARGWYDVFNEDVLAQVMVNNKPYAVPVNIHRINSLFYRNDLFEKYSLKLPHSLPELEKLCEEISENDELQDESPTGRVSCLALGNKWNWTLAMMAFEMILPAVGGADYYLNYLEGDEHALDPEVLETLSWVQKFYCGKEPGDCPSSGWFNPDVNDRTWDEAVLKLTDGQALMAPAGDWAKGLLQSEGLSPGEDFDVIPFPGTEDMHVFTVDTFVLPKGAVNRDGARSFLRTVGSREGQIAFNPVKGSVPARIDVDEADFDPVAQSAMEHFGNATRIPAMSALLAGDARAGLEAELTASMKVGNTDIVKRYLSANYPLE